jgi:hypothetical protein
MKEIKCKVVNSEEAQNILLSCGIYPKKKGYGYLLAAIEIFRGPTHGMCEVYNSVGKIFEVTPASVERCIRTCLNEAFYTNSFMYLNKIFKSDIFKKETFLSNGDFIGIVATYLDLINAPSMSMIPIDNKKE